MILRIEPSLSQDRCVNRWATELIGYIDRILFKYTRTEHYSDSTVRDLLK